VVRTLRCVLVVCLAVAASCSNEDADDNVIQDTSSTSADPSTTSTTTADPTTSTTAFDGSTTPTSAPSTTSGVALLTNVEVADGFVTFTFRDETPGYDVGYVEPPIHQDGSGDEIVVAGAAFLGVRMEPASGVDMSGESFQETYTGPDRVPGTGVIAEVVRTGDFEANATWVVGLDARRPYRVEAAASMLRVYFST
jgi:hypothetical protein